MKNLILMDVYLVCKYFLVSEGRRQKKWYFWVVPTTKWPTTPPPLPVVVKVPPFLWEIFVLLRIPWYGKIIEQIWEWNFYNNKFRNSKGFIFNIHPSKLTFSSVCPFLSRKSAVFLSRKQVCFSPLLIKETQGLLINKSKRHGEAI